MLCYHRSIVYDAHGHTSTQYLRFTPYSSVVQDIAAGKHIKERDGRMEMRLRPEDPECHPILADREPSCCLLLRVTPGAPGEEELEASVIGVATHEYNFKGEWLLTMFA